MTSSRELSKRWFASDGELVTSEHVRHCFMTGSFSDIELFGRVDGRVDLRGVPIGPGLLTLSGLVISGVDLSGTGLANLRFINCTVKDSLFSEADCSGWRLWGTTIRDSSFARADLRGSSLGAWKDGRGNTFERVDFAHALLQGVGTSAAVYLNCDFSFAKLDGINFWQSSLIEAKFAGVVKNVIFDGRMLGEEKPDPNPMRDVDLSLATLDGCDFRGISFESIHLPPDRELLLFDDIAVVDELIDLLALRLDDPVAALAHAVLVQLRRPYRPGTSILLNLRDIGPAADVVRGLLTEIE